MNLDRAMLDLEDDLRTAGYALAWSCPCTEEQHNPRYCPLGRPRVVRPYVGPTYVVERAVVVAEGDVVTLDVREIVPLLPEHQPVPEPPRNAVAMAEAAKANGWTVWVGQARGPKPPRMTMVDLVVVHCERGRECVFATWLDGKAANGWRLRPRLEGLGVRAAMHAVTAPDTPS